MINSKQYKQQQLPIVIQKYEDSLRESMYKQQYRKAKGSYMYDHSLSVERANYSQSINKVSIRSSSNCQQQKNQRGIFLCSLTPSSKNIKNQNQKFTFNIEEINKQNQKLKTDVQLLYQLINLEKQTQNKLQNPLKTLQKSKLIDSIYKDKNELDKTQQIIENCQMCKKSNNGKIVQTICDHFYHYDCFLQYLERCIKKGNSQINCHCKVKIPQQIILNNANILIIQRYFQNLYQKLQIKYFKYYNFKKCINSFCNFFWITTNDTNKKKTSIFSYCPYCLNKNFEIGLQMEKIFNQF